MQKKCFFSPSSSPEKNSNLEQQLTPERSEGVSSCSNLLFFEGLEEGEKKTLVCKHYNIYRFLVLILILSFSPLLQRCRSFFRFFSLRRARMCQHDGILASSGRIQGAKKTQNSSQKQLNRLLLIAKVCRSISVARSSKFCYFQP